MEKYHCECKRCGVSWEAKKENPRECVACRSRAWNKESVGFIPDHHLPMPKVNHSVNMSLPFIGARCPYCKGTTGLDGYRGVVFCFSCDATFRSTKPMDFLGVIVGIGARR